MSKIRMPGQQRGIAVVMSAGFMLLAVLCLTLVVDTGRLYLEKRKLQKVADLAALESAGRQGCTEAHDAYALAVQSAQRNGFLIGASRRLEVSCGVIELVDGARRFEIDQGATEALQVLAKHDVPASLITGGVFKGQVTLIASAVAVRADPTAVFRVGSRLLEVNGQAPLMALLRLIGLNLDQTTVLSYNSLANVSITPSGLLKLLGIPVTVDIGVGELNALLAAREVSLGELLDVAVTLAGQEQLLGVNLILLNALKVGLGLNELKVQLGTDPAVNGRRGLFALIEAGTGKAGLNVQVDALSLVTAAIGIATSQNGVSVNLGASGLLTGLQVGARVVEPASIGIGGVGTKAYNAQVRLHVDVNTSKGLTGVLGLLGTSIRLPIIVDAVSAQGTITRIDCDAFPRTVTIAVNSRVAAACIGHVPAGVLWSKSNVCTEDLRDALMVRALGLTILEGQVNLPVLEKNETVTLAVGESATTGFNELNIGTLVRDLVTEVLDLLGDSQVTRSALTTEQAAQVADSYLALPELMPGGSGGNYSPTDLKRIQDRMSDDGVNWTRPAFLFSGTMLEQWRNAVNIGCASGFSYSVSCVREKLVSALQTDAAKGWLDALLTGAISHVVQPLLGAILNPLVTLLEELLNAVGKLLANLLAKVIGLELGRSDVTLDSVTCGSATLVI